MRLFKYVLKKAEPKEETPYSNPPHSDSSKEELTAASEPTAEKQSELLSKSEAPKGTTASTVKGLLADLLEQDYHRMGIQEGLQCGRYEEIELSLERLSEAFRVELERVSQSIQSQVIRQRSRLSEPLKAHDLGLYLQIESELEQLELQVEQLSQQQLFICTQEGWFRKALLDFRSGYKKGVRLCITDENLFNHNQLL
ncbi:MAG: hypothetical protein LAT68_00510 [Cyclobacteriaceae bacterium]|nr:hypothetical protein [Cyclobacteriaceae bacterium]MCH8514784.1 hypothetical protein [Cyclobacteriaceae bacterium]